jgi:TetR/AcrR family transcriptional regulator
MSAETPEHRLTRDELDRRGRILLVAAQDFAQRGRAAVRVDEIARRANVNKQLIYYYFGSKDALFSAVLEWMVEENAPLWREIRHADMRKGIDRLTSNPPDPDVDWPRLLAWEGLEYGGPDETSDIVLHERRTAAYQTGVDLFERAKKAQDLDDAVDSEMLALTVSLLQLSSKVVPQVVTMTTGLDAGSPEYREKVRRFIEDLLARMGPR